MKNLILITSLVVSIFAFAEKNPDAYNVGSDKLAVEGYDVVAYFDGEAQKGSQDISTVLEGITYLFTSEANKSEFLSNTDKYQPAYGGWCALAAASRVKIGIDPEKFIVTGNRLFLFSFLNGKDAKVGWEENSNPTRLERRADRWWKRTSGEEARNPNYEI